MEQRGKQDKMIKKAMKQARRPVREQPMVLRCITIILVFVVAAGGLGLRLYQLQVQESASWLNRANGQQMRNIAITPARGTIYDSEMKLLAQSAPVWTITAAPDVVNVSSLKGELEGAKDTQKAVVQALAGVLELTEDEQNTLYEALCQVEKRWCKVKALVDKPVADEVKEICSEYGIKGIYYEQDAKRIYPYEDLAATVLGFVTDGNGREGLEYHYDELLVGTPGRRVATVNALGNEIAAGEDAITYPAEDGNSLVLTINADIQQVLEKYVSMAVMEHNATERGMGIVMDVNTGEILAMSVYPSYNPNEPYYIFDDLRRAELEYIYDEDLYTTVQSVARQRQWRNKPLVDTYEPGSVFKIITAAAAIDSGKYDINSPFYCGGRLQVADREMSCANGAVHLDLNLGEALIESCNVSFITMAQGMGLDTWYSYVKAFGLTEPTGIDMPGEPSQAALNNVIYSPEQMGVVEFASCSFGQSNKYTALQMITAVSAAINGGNLMQPYMVKQVLDAGGNVVQSNEPVVKRQVISEETSAALRETLEELVNRDGLGNYAYVPGYHVGGKSGTSQKLDKLAIDPDNPVFISSFLGFAPAYDPQIAVLIALDEPDDERGTYFGSRLVGPSIKGVINESMQILGVEPLYSEEDLARTTQTCPGVVGETVSEAQNRLNSAGLIPTIIGSGETVTGQYPEAYTQVPGRGSVVLYTDPAEPLRMVTMPSMINRSASNAITELKRLGLNVVTTGALDSTVGARVIEQSQEAGAQVKLGEVITLVLDNPSGTEGH